MLFAIIDSCVPACVTASCLLHKYHQSSRTNAALLKTNKSQGAVASSEQRHGQLSSNRSLVNRKGSYPLDSTVAKKNTVEVGFDRPKEDIDLEITSTVEVGCDRLKEDMHLEITSTVEVGFDRRKEDMDLEMRSIVEVGFASERLEDSNCDEIEHTFPPCETLQLNDALQRSTGAISLESRSTSEADHDTVSRSSSRISLACSQNMSPASSFIVLPEASNEVMQLEDAGNLQAQDLAKTAAHVDKDLILVHQTLPEDKDQKDGEDILLNDLEVNLKGAASQQERSLIRAALEKELETFSLQFHAPSAPHIDDFPCKENMLEPNADMNRGRCAFAERGRSRRNLSPANKASFRSVSPAGRERSLSMQWDSSRTPSPATSNSSSCKSFKIVSRNAKATAPKVLPESVFPCVRSTCPTVIADAPVSHIRAHARVLSFPPRRHFLRATFPVSRNREQQ